MYIYLAHSMLIGPASDVLIKDSPCLSCQRGILWGTVPGGGPVVTLSGSVGRVG